MFYKSGVVSPPWYGNRTGSTERLLPNEDARMPRGAYAPRSCVGVRMSAGEIAIFAMHKRTSAGATSVSPPWVGKGSRLQGIANNLRGIPTAESRAANRQPAVAPETAPAMAIGFRGVITFTTHDRMVDHGWLTSAAPGARSRSAEK
jgi:hypothetical protein